jgi:hypothetical protein
MNTDHETIAEFLETAKGMPSTLKSNPGSLLKMCLQVMQDNGDDPRALSHMLEAAMLYICARHRRQIIEQLRATANEHRRSLH